MSAPAPLAPLWLCVQLPRLPLEALPQQALPRVIWDQHGARRWVVASAAETVKPGEALGSVQARYPDLPIQRRDLRAERAALEAVACLVYQLGDRIAISDDAPRGLFDLPFQAVSVDIAPSLKLFGGLEALLGKAHALFAATAYTPHFGVGPTLEAAALIAASAQAPIRDSAHLPDWLARLPLRATRLPFNVLDLLESTGHRMLGELLQRDRAALAARLGTAIPQWIDRLLGRHSDVREWFEPPRVFRRRMDFDAELDHTEALLFPMRRALDELENYLRARQLAVCEVQLHLSRRGSVAQDLRLRTTAPVQDAATLLRLLRERWNHQPPDGAVSRVLLRAERFLPLVQAQTDLFGNGSRDGEAWDALLDRLRARLGDEAVWQPGCVEDHRPERAWSPSGNGRAHPQQALRPFWLLKQPQAFSPQGKLLTPAERLCSGWWDTDPIDRDYHWVRTRDGRRLWIYKDREHADRWLLHGEN